MDSLLVRTSIALAAVLFLYILATVTYNLLLPPLPRHPGPVRLVSQPSLLGLPCRTPLRPCTPATALLSASAPTSSASMLGRTCGRTTPANLSGQKTRRGSSTPLNGIPNIVGAP